MSNKRFTFRAWYKDPYSDEPKPMMFYCAEDAYDHIRGIPAQCFVDLLDEDEFVLMQCTGLTDKNGNLIYEGDTYNGRYGPSNMYVGWCDTCCGFSIKEVSGYCLSCSGDSHWCEFVESVKDGDIEVTGNIYENPELLEG